MVSNGLLSFGRGVTYINPVNSREYNNLIAPFWADHDNRFLGSISYEVHRQIGSMILGSTTSLLGQINTWISLQKEVVFEGTWMLVAEWNDVPENGSTFDKVKMCHLCIIKSSIIHSRLLSNG